MTTKNDVINGAYSQMRISGLTVDPTPEDVSVALERLEDMMAEFAGLKNICTDYNFEINPEPESLTNVPQPYWHFMKTNLAVRLIPDFNKAVPQTLLDQATQSLSAASAKSAADNIQQVQYPWRQPRGSGNTLRYNRWRRYMRPDPDAPNKCATNDIVVGEINDYQESFRAYLTDDEVISTFKIEADPAIEIQSSSNSSPVILYSVKAVDDRAQGSWQQVKITITTSDGRVEIRLIDFSISSAKTVGS